jgi:hypothetical protein
MSKNLTSRILISDLLTVVFIPGMAAALYPETGDRDNSKLRIILFVSTLLLSSSAVWFGTTIAESFEVKNIFRRTMIHLYATVAFVSFILFVPLTISCISGLLADRPLRTELMVQLILATIVSGSFTASLYFVEQSRRVADAAKTVRE